MRYARRVHGLKRWLLRGLCVCLPALGWSAEGPPAFKILGQTAAEWAARLTNSETLDEQRLAVYCLGEFGPGAKAAVPVIEKVVRETRYHEVKWHGIEALGLIGPAASPALDGLLAILGDDNSNPGLRLKALEAVARIAPEDPRVAGVVLQTVNSPVLRLSRAAIDAAVTVAMYNREVEAIPALTRAAWTAERAEASTLALRCLGPRGVEPLMEVLAKGEEGSRMAAAAQLARMGEQVRPAAEALRRAVKRERTVKVRVAILEVLAGLAPDDAELLGVARELLSETDARGRAEEVLACAGTAALPQLREAFRMRDPMARAAVARLCGRLGADAKPLVGELELLLKDRDEDVRVEVAEALGRMGPAAKSAHSALREVAGVSSGRLKRSAELAVINVSRPDGTPPRRSTLEVLSDEEVVRFLQKGEPARLRVEAAGVLCSREGVGGEALVGALRDPDLDVRVAAAKALAFHGVEAKAAVPQIIPWLRVPELKLQRAALALLAATGPETPEATAAVVEFTLSPDAPKDVETSLLVEYALRAHGVEAARLLARSLGSEDAGVATRAAGGLAKLREIAVAVHPDLQRAALSTDEGVMRASVDALCRLGPAAREDVPMLVRFLSYAAPAWRRAAAEALGSIVADHAKDDASGVVEALLPVLLDPDPDISWSGYLALYLIGKPALPKLRWLMEINQNDVPFPVLRVMAKLKADPETVLPKITALARPGQRAEERVTAAGLLSLYAPEHVEPLPVLIGMLRDRDRFVARAARAALETYGRAAVPALEAALRGRDPAIRREALELLEQLRSAK